MRKCGKQICNRRLRERALSDLCVHSWFEVTGWFYMQMTYTFLSSKRNQTNTAMLAASMWAVSSWSTPLELASRTFSATVSQTEGWNCSEVKINRWNCYINNPVTSNDTQIHQLQRMQIHQVTDKHYTNSWYSVYSILLQGLHLSSSRMLTIAAHLPEVSTPNPYH